MLEVGDTVGVAWGRVIGVLEVGDTVGVGYGEMGVRGRGYSSRGHDGRGQGGCNSDGRGRDVVVRTVRVVVVVYVHTGLVFTLCMGSNNRSGRGYGCGGQYFSCIVQGVNMVMVIGVGVGVVLVRV